MRRYKKTPDGMRYLFYDEPIHVMMSELTTIFPDRGALLFQRKWKNDNMIQVFAHFKPMEGWDPEDYYANAVYHDLPMDKYAGKELELISRLKEEQSGKEEPQKKNWEDDLNLSNVIRQIRNWLEKTSYKEFLKVLTDRVVGQEAVKIVAANVYNYLNCVAYGKTHNNNVLLAAPSGCGKTETYRALKEYFVSQIPQLVIYQVDMTSITEEGYKGRDTNDVVRPLLEHAEDNGVGIVFMDEFDKKLLPSYTGSGQNVNLAVQSQILTLIEGREVSDEKKNKKIYSGNTMFVGLGAYAWARDKGSEGTKRVGFGQVNEKGQDHYRDVTREDMIETGASYELIGRFMTVINYHKLTPEDVDRIIDGMVQRVSDSLECKVELSAEMRAELHNSANGKFGCRILESSIRETAFLGYAELLESEACLDECVILLMHSGEARTQVKGNCEK